MKEKRKKTNKQTNKQTKKQRQKRARGVGGDGGVGAEAFSERVRA